MRQIVLPESDILKSWHGELTWRLLRLFLLLTEQQKTWKIWQSKPKSNAQLPDDHRKYLWSISSEVEATKSEGNKWHNLSMTTMQICQVFSLCTALFTFTHCIYVLYLCYVWNPTGFRHLPVPLERRKVFMQQFFVICKGGIHMHWLFCSGVDLFYFTCTTVPALLTWETTAWHAYIATKL